MVLMKETRSKMMQAVCKKYCRPALSIAVAWAVLAPAMAQIGPQVNLPRVKLSAGMHLIDAQVAQSPEQRQIGLMLRKDMPQGEGMFFIFDRAEILGFWMPDMNFAIDIVWIGEDWKIVDISHDVTLQSYPKVFSPTVPALYVLEVPAGFARKNRWNAGDAVVLSDANH